jgi:hypothetical protein
MPRKIREIRIEGNIAYVPLTRGYEAIIDAADVPLVEGRNWWATPYKSNDGRILGFYAITKTKEKKIEWLHRTIMNPKHGIIIDHINCNGLDNRRCNLREASVKQNAHNARTPVNNTSGYKGVSWNIGSNKWQAHIALNNKKRHLGLFTNVEDAAHAYAVASAQLHGEFGRLA